MNIVDIINKKRLNKELTYEEIKYFIDGIMSGEIKDYQASSLLMAICINKMTDDEVISLTKCIIESGDVFEFPGINELICDKHSTGGVGDKTTLLILPLCKSSGVKLAKLSGRALGNTGGTIDKLESIKGFNVNLSDQEIYDLVKNEGVCISSQTKNITPADKILYALRDVTGTVSSVHLIAASIMSKKIATSPDVILLDVKVGSGALLTNYEDTLELSRLMIKIGEAFNKKVIVYLTDMDSPLGNNVGNSLEVIEVMNILQNKTYNDLTKLSIEITSELLSASKDISFDEARRTVIDNFENGNAYNAFLKIIKNQGGIIESITTYEEKLTLLSKEEGFITKINASIIGEYCMKLGAGRINKDSIIDHEVGIELKCSIGQYVKKNEPLLFVHTNKDTDITKLYDAFEFGDTSIKKEIIKKKIYSSNSMDSN